MFGSIGITEIIIIAGITLVILGPDKFPEFAKIVARTVKDVRGYVSEAQREIAKEITPVKKELAKLSRVDTDEYIDSLTGDAFKDTDTTDSTDDDLGDPEPDDSADPYGQDGAYQYGGFSTNPYEESSPSEAGNPEEEVTEASTAEPTGEAQPTPSDGPSETDGTDKSDASSERLDG